MNKTQRAILLAVSVLVVVSLVFVSTINLKPTTATMENSVALSVYSFTMENMTDYLQLSLCILDQKNDSVAVNGTATLSILDNKSSILYQSTFSMLEKDFQNVSTPNGNKLMRIWKVNYSEMKLSSARGGVMTCNLKMNSAAWRLSAVSNNLGVPAALSIYKLHFIEATPRDQKLMMANNVIQAGVTYEPYASEVEIEEIGKVVLRSSDVWPNHPSYVLIMNKSWAQSNQDQAARVVRAHIDAEYWIQEALANPATDNYKHLIEKAMEISGESEEIVKEALTHIKFNFELTDQAKAYLKLYSDGYIEEGIYSLQDLQSRGYMNSEAFANSYIDNTYLSLAQSITPTNDRVGSVSLGFVKGNIFMLSSAIALDETIWSGETAFERYGLEVNLPEPAGYNTSALNAAALMRGNVSAAYVAICPAVLDRVIYGMRSIIVAQMTAEGTAVVLKSNIFSFDDLAGKVIASPGAVTIQGIFMMEVAEQIGFTLQPRP